MSYALVAGDVVQLPRGGLTILTVVSLNVPQRPDGSLIGTGILIELLQGLIRGVSTVVSTPQLDSTHTLDVYIVTFNTFFSSFSI